MNTRPKHHSSTSRELPIQSLDADGPRFHRREFLWHFGGGLGGIALAHLLGRNGLLADTPAGAPPRGPHPPARAGRFGQLFMRGAASQCDTFDYNPLLIRRSGEKFDPGEKV